MTPRQRHRDLSQASQKVLSAVAEPSADKPFLHPKHLLITVSQDESPASGGKKFPRKHSNKSIPMKLTIEIPEHYYDINADNPASLVLEVAQTDWKEFAFDMAEVVEKALVSQA